MTARTSRSTAYFPRKKFPPVVHVIVNGVRKPYAELTAQERVYHFANKAYLREVTKEQNSLDAYERVLERRGRGSYVSEREYSDAIDRHCAALTRRDELAEVRQVLLAVFA
jgi:hypothetical protein